MQQLLVANPPPAIVHDVNTSHLPRAGLLDTFEASLRAADVLIAGKAERKSRRSMAGLRRWKGELLESEHRRLFVCLHPANKVALNYETALWCSASDTTIRARVPTSSDSPPIPAGYMQLYKHMYLHRLSIYLSVYLSV